MSEAISKIVLELLEMHNSGKLSVFIYFHGHVNKLSVDIYIPKWEINADPDFTAEAYLNKPESVNTFEQEINRFIKLFKLLTK